MNKLFTLLFLIFSGVAFANPPGTYQTLFLSNVTPTLTFQTSAENTSPGGASVNFTSQAFGTANSTRVVYVCATGTIAGAGSLSSATIGGIAATIHIQTNGAARGLSAIISALVPTGTTGTVTLNYSGTLARVAIGVWSAINVSSPTAVATNGATTTTSSQAQAMPVNVSAGGFALGCSYDNGDTPIPSIVWAGVTSRYDQNAAGDGNSGADTTSANGATPQTVTATWTTSSRGAGSSASFR